MVWGSFAYHYHNKKLFLSLLYCWNILQLSLKKQSIARALLIMVSTWSWSLEWSGSDQLDGLGHHLNRIRWSAAAATRIPKKPSQPTGPPFSTWDKRHQFIIFSLQLLWQEKPCVGLSSRLHIRTQMHIFHNLVVFVYDQVNDKMKLIDVFRCWKCKASRLDGCKCICEWQDEISPFNLSFKRNRNDKLRYEWSRQGSRKFDGDSYLLWPEIDGL